MIPFSYVLWTTDCKYGIRMTFHRYITMLCYINLLFGVSQRISQMHNHVRQLNYIFISGRVSREDYYTNNAFLIQRSPLIILSSAKRCTLFIQGAEVKHESWHEYLGGPWQFCRSKGSHTRLSFQLG